MRFASCVLVCKYNAVHVFVTRNAPICDLTPLYETSFNIRHTKDPAEGSSGIHVNMHCDHSEQIHSRMQHYQVRIMQNLFKKCFY